MFIEKFFKDKPNWFGEMCKKQHDISTQSGFHNEKKSWEHFMMLVFTEFAEIIAADRKMKHANIKMFNEMINHPQPEGKEESHWKFCFETVIKNTVEDEIADVFLRIFDMVEEFNLDVILDIDRYVAELHNWSGTKLESEYNKQLLTEKMFSVIYRVFWYGNDTDNNKYAQVDTIMYEMLKFCEINKIDIQWHIEHKLHYNELNIKSHGKRY